MSMELWSGFFGTIIGAGIGGSFAYFIAKFQFNRQERQFRTKEKQDKKKKKYNFFGRFILILREIVRILNFGINMMN